VTTTFRFSKFKMLGKPEREVMFIETLCVSSSVAA
jgi:hypothetical protein